MNERPEIDRAECWNRALASVLDDSIAHLQQLIFQERWAEIRREARNDEEALRASLTFYERGLVDLLGFARQLGVAADGLAWSEFKAFMRRAAHDAGEEISLRTALNEALYLVDQLPPGDSDAYRRWCGALMDFLALRVRDRPGRPLKPDPEDARVTWALSCLADLEDYAEFQRAFENHVRSVAGDESLVRFQARLLPEPRFDLVLNTALRWIANCA